MVYDSEKTNYMELFTSEMYHDIISTNLILICI